MSCNSLALASICTVKSTCSQSNNHSSTLVELGLHADICVVGSKVVVIHNHEHYVNVYSFDKETQHDNACTIDFVITYKDSVTHFTLIMMTT